MLDDMKKKAIGGIKEMLEGRMVDRMKPKPPPPGINAAKPGDPDSEAGEDPKEEAMESPVMEGKENDLESKLPPGAEMDRLSPEEQHQLEMLYSKMGC